MRASDSVTLGAGDPSSLLPCHVNCSPLSNAKAAAQQIPSGRCASRSDTSSGKTFAVSMSNAKYLLPIALRLSTYHQLVCIAATQHARLRRLDQPLFIFLRLLYGITYCHAYSHVPSYNHEVHKASGNWALDSVQVASCQGERPEPFPRLRVRVGPSTTPPARDRYRRCPAARNRSMTTPMILSSCGFWQSAAETSFESQSRNSFCSSSSDFASQGVVSGCD